MSDEPSQMPHACPHPEAVGTRYGDPIAPDRQVELQAYLDRWHAETDHGERKGPFAGKDKYSGVSLTGADVAWLTEQSGRDRYGRAPNLHLEGADLRAAHLERANLRLAHLEEADLIGANLERADLRLAHLEGANLSETHLEGAILHQAHLEGAHLSEAHLEGAHLVDVHLEEATLSRAHLEWAQLYAAHLEGADLRAAHLEGANLRLARLDEADLRLARLEGANLFGAHLEQANFREAHLERADLRNTWMDKATQLNGAVLDRASVDQVNFDGVNLAVVKWKSVVLLGDEVEARAAKDEDGKRKNRETRLTDYEAAVRAHLQLAAVLRSQGMSEQADRFTSRSQRLQRVRYRLQRRFG